MFMLRKITYQNHQPQKGVIAMTKAKVQNNKQQIKLVFGEGAVPGFDLDQLVEQLGLELQALKIGRASCRERV